MERGRFSKCHFGSFTSKSINLSIIESTNLVHNIVFMIVEIKGKDELHLKLEDAEQQSTLFILEFVTPWCGACKMVQGKITQIAGEHPTVEFIKINLEEYEDIGQDYDVESTPTFVFIKNQEVLAQFSGTKHEKVTQAINKFK